MPTFYESMTDNSKAKWRKLGQQIRGFDFNPDDGHREPRIKVSGKLEDTEEIGRLMQEKPGFGRENEKSL